MSRVPMKVRALRALFRTAGTVAPGVAARWAEAVYCTPPRRASAAGDEAFLATGARFGVRCEGQDLAAWEWGRGPTVLLAHGWGSGAVRFRDLITTLTGAGFRVVAHDAPAHGLSTGQRATLPEFARALREVANHAGELHAVLGHSLGGAAACVAIRDGLQVRRLVIAASPADVQRHSENFADHLRIPAAARAIMWRNLEARLGAGWDELYIPGFAPAILVPTLVIHDRNDAEVPFTQAETLASAFPHARLLATSGFGHRALLADPAVVSETIAFIAQERE